MKYIRELPVGIRQITTIIGAVLGLLVGIFIGVRAEEYELVEGEEDVT